MCVTLNEADIEAVVREAMERIRRKRAKHGEHAETRHSTLGILTEEYYEACDAIRDDDHPERFRAELLDIAAVCLDGVASIDARVAANVASRREASKTKWGAA